MTGTFALSQHVEPHVEEIIDVPATMALMRAERTPSGMLALLTQVNDWLANARTLQDIQGIKLLGEQAVTLARECKLGAEAKRQAREIVVVAEKRLGEYLAGTARAVGGRPGKTGTCSLPVSTLSELSISKKESSRCQRLAKLPPALFDKVRQGWSLERAEAEVRRAAKAEEFKNRFRARRFDPATADLRTCSCADLFASGITPQLVITEPPSSRDSLPLFSDLAQACIHVPFVAVVVKTKYLDKVFERLCARLNYRDADLTGTGKLVLMFGGDDAKANTVFDATADDPYERVIQRLAPYGALVCDPFVRAETAIAALLHNHPFVGCDVDAERVAAVRRAVDDEVWHITPEDERWPE